MSYSICIAKLKRKYISNEIHICILVHDYPSLFSTKRNLREHVKCGFSSCLYKNKWKKRVTCCCCFCCIWSHSTLLLWIRIWITHAIVATHWPFHVSVSTRQSAHGLLWCTGRVGSCAATSGHCASTKTTTC